MPYAEMHGDRKDLQVAAEDIALVKKVRAAGIPVITILLSGRPLILGQLLDESDALVAAWLPGTEGQGIADVLFGDYAPTGKLPCTWPRSMVQLAHKTDQNTQVVPLFPYGFGLTYPSVEVSRQGTRTADNIKAPAL
jgi:beta-glucosidase